jgi:hypothetical protein
MIVGGGWHSDDENGDQGGDGRTRDRGQQHRGSSVHGKQPFLLHLGIWID